MTSLFLAAPQQLKTIQVKPVKLAARTRSNALALTLLMVMYALVVPLCHIAPMLIFLVASVSILSAANRIEDWLYNKMAKG